MIKIISPVRFIGIWYWMESIQERLTIRLTIYVLSDDTRDPLRTWV